MVQIVEDEFGRTKQPSSSATEIVRRFTFSNGNGVTVQVITYGATITSVRTPDRNGVCDDVALGFDNMNGYLTTTNPYFGATIGRVCNRIGNAKFVLNGSEYQLAKNNGDASLHGGFIGFDKFNWSAYINGDKVIMSHVTSVTFQLTEDNDFKVNFTATISKPTPINLTNHSYFNLAGHGAGYQELYNHSVVLNADKYTVTDAASIPTGEIRPVSGTPFDLRVRQNLGLALENLPEIGFDDNYCVVKRLEKKVSFVAGVAHEKSGRTLEIYSDQPGVQFYTANFMPDPDNNVITYGATITSIKVPDRNGVVADIALGFDGMNGYLSANNPYFGATIGRVCNRTGQGKFTLNGKEYALGQNRPPNHLHGGNIGFDKFNWSAIVNGDKVVMTLVNDDGFEGYPGTVLTSVTYQLTDNDEFRVSFAATTSKPTPINLTNHSYYNLAGHSAGYEELYNHSIALNADKYTVTDATAVSTGEIQSVAGTPLDLRIRQNLGTALVNLPKSGFDNNYCVTQGTDQQLTFVARVVHEKSGRTMEFYSDQPGVQFYTSNFMPDPENNIYPKGKTQDANPLNANQPISGKGGAQYRKHAGFAMETQKYPDSVNHANFPSVIVLPGEVYRHEFVYKFGIE